MREQYIVRFPDGLRGRIKAAAKANRRSMNNEIVLVLEERFPATEPGTAATGEGLGNSAPVAAEINRSGRAVNSSPMAKMESQR